MELLNLLDVSQHLVSIDGVLKHPFVTFSGTETPDSNFDSWLLGSWIYLVFSGLLVCLSFAWVVWGLYEVVISTNPTQINPNYSEDGIIE